MIKTKLTPVILAITVLVGACSSMPKTTSLLDQTRSDYVMAQNNPKVANYAALEMKQAGDAMAQANDAATDRDSLEKIDRLAYIAKQKIALAQEVAKKKTAEADVANAGKERDQIRLDQRTNEANQAKATAEQAKMNEQLAQSQAVDAQNQAADAQRMKDEAQRKMQESQAYAAQLEAQLADLAAKKTERGLVITLGDVLFSTGQAVLNQDGMNKARKLADVLQKNPERNVLIEGFTDSTGASGYNQELSERRATAVSSALASMGIARERVAIRGYGENYPVAANDTAQNRQMNRRVEIIISDATGKIGSR
jgi:outer membrane protein OmpA-like peptidoglycan-associated protein